MPSRLHLTVPENESARPDLKNPWEAVLAAHQQVADANEALRRALGRMDVALDQQGDS